MTENEFLLQDRIAKIKSVVQMYGEDNFYVAFSGGKDSTALSELIDIALPNNKIPRVYANTGIEYNLIRDFVREKSEHDSRFIILSPTVSIKAMLEDEGYPFKSKMHSSLVEKYQRGGFAYKSVRAYTQMEKTLNGQDCYRPCPQKLMFQFTPENKLKISDHCCYRLKEEPLEKWCYANNKSIAIVGIMREEGGRRFKAQCLQFKGKKLRKFQPLAVIGKEWENWFINTYNIQLCTLYYPPYNFSRTGCKGCPFALRLEDELNTLEEYFPNERKQCEIIWKPVYDEYRRLGYRLK